MDQPQKPSPVRIAVQSWKDTIQAVRLMPLLFGIAVAAFFVMDTLWEPVAAKFADPNGIPRNLLGFLHSCLGGIAVAPLAIAMHRYVLLGEIGASYSFNPSNRRLARFVIAEIFYAALFFAPLTAATLAMNTWTLSLPVAFGSLLAIAALVVVAIRFLLVFPAIAVDAPGASWTNALVDSRGHTLRLFLTLTLASMVILVPAYSLFAVVPTSHPVGRNVVAFVQSIAHILYIAVTATIASYFFRAIGQRLNQP